MEGFKEFQGKDLDGAIEEACGYFNTAREKLEIEIVQDAKSGIFGIVGARKAKVRARRVQLRETVDSILGRKGGEGSLPPTPPDVPAATGEQTAAAAEPRKTGNAKPAPTPVAEAEASNDAGADAAAKASEAQTDMGRERSPASFQARSSRAGVQPELVLPPVRRGPAGRLAPRHGPAAGTAKRGRLGPCPG